MGKMPGPRVLLSNTLAKMHKYRLAPGGNFGGMHAIACGQFRGVAAHVAAEAAGLWQFLNKSER
jgi:hypothetical protein